ncbi:M28 family peptidase [bacterium]|nr:M28 family peptidase [bacterium]
MPPVSSPADPASRCASRCLRARAPSALSALTLAALLALPPAAGAAGLAFVSGSRADAARAAAGDLGTLVWELPGGVLVADRVSPAGEHRFGRPLVPSWPDGEWFLVRAKGRAHGRPVTTSDLAAVGRVHLALDGAWVVEIPPAQAEAFAALGAGRQRLRLDAPPPGWDRLRGRMAATAPATRAAKDLALKTAFAAVVAADSIFTTIRRISGSLPLTHAGQTRTIATRYYSAPDKAFVADALAATLAAWGYDVTFQSFTHNQIVCRNVVATRLGAVAPAEYVVVGGHYDSTSQTPSSLAPGAEDNASGTALVLELARVAAGRTFDRSLQFVLFDAEERGLIGSDRFVDEAVAGGRVIVGALIHDMVAFHAANYAIRIEGQPAWESLMSAMAANVDALTDLGWQKDYYSWGSDHVPFQQAGYPAFLAIDYDWDDYGHYHRTTDTWAAIAATAAKSVQVARAGAGLVADLAGLQPAYVAGAGDVAPAALPALTAAPNPFNPRVSVTFALAEASVAELAVFDLAGRRLRVLQAGALAAGAHAFTWDGRDAGGRALPSGAYLCRLSLPQGEAATRLLLVR